MDYSYLYDNASNLHANVLEFIFLIPSTSAKFYGC